MGEELNHTEWQKRQTSIHELNSLGMWVDAWSLDPNFEAMYSKACHRIYKYSYEKCSLSSPNVGLQYTWKSHTQQNYPWNAQHFCRIMNGRHLMIVGDSLNEEMFFSLYSAMTSHVPLYKDATIEQLQSKKDRMYEECKNAYCELMRPSCDATLVIDCGSSLPSFNLTLGTDYYFFEQMKYYTSKYGTKPFIGEPDDQNDYNNWVWKIRELNVSVLLVNHGAHFLPLNESVTKHKEAMNDLFLLYPELSVIYRNTPPGHLNCNNLYNSPPLTSLQDLLPDGKPGNNYHWEEFARVNEAVYELMRTHFPQVVWLDVATSGSLRADSHVGGEDCLHYCTPGPLDNYVLLLYQSLIYATNQPPPARQEDWMERQIAIEKTLVPATLANILPASQRDPRGDLLMHGQVHSPYVFLLVNGTKRPFNSAQALMNMGREFSEIKRVHSGSLCDIPTGPLIF